MGATNLKSSDIVICRSRNYITLNFADWPAKFKDYIRKDQ